LKDRRRDTKGVKLNAMENEKQNSGGSMILNKSSAPLIYTQACIKCSRRNVAWKESVQRYEANAMRNIAETRRKLIAGENLQHGFMEFTLHERGKNGT
jgi:hypothetical protein